MKRFTLPLLAAAFLVGCGPSRMPTDYTGSTTGSGNGGATDLNLLGAGAAGGAAQAARDGVIPPEAILVTVQFDFDQYTVSATERAKLDAAAGKAKATKLLIVGYTDQFGTEEYNLGLSDKRAQSVRDYLVKLGCNPADSEVLGLGEQQADKSAAGRQSGAKDRKAVVVDANYFTRGGTAAPAAVKAAPAAGKAAPAKAPVSGPAPGPVTAL
ncbi:MAG: OmpA family protein [Opitutia bacterium]